MHILPCQLPTYNSGTPVSCVRDFLDIVKKYIPTYVLYLCFANKKFNVTICLYIFLLYFIISCVFFFLFYDLIETFLYLYVHVQ